MRDRVVGMGDHGETGAAGRGRVDRTRVDAVAADRAPVGTERRAAARTIRRLGAAAGQVRPRPATPFEPIAAIFVALERHEIVAIGDPHGNEQAHEFWLSLIRDPRFAAAFDDIAVEWGNALYQELIDRFINGDDVSEAELRQVWWNTTHPGQGYDRPITEARVPTTFVLKYTLSGSA